jgi:hypothetical protein
LALASTEGAGAGEGGTKEAEDAAWARFDRFWPGRPEARSLLHPVYLYQSGETAYAIHDEGELVAYLLGFIAPSIPPEGYLHMVAVREDRPGRGLARRLDEHFEAEARRQGAVALRGITTPGNAGSIAFHRRVGFQLVNGGAAVGDVPVVPDYAGPNQHRVVLLKRLEAL